MFLTLAQGYAGRKQLTKFTYRRTTGSTLSEPDVVKRVRALAIPRRGSMSGIALLQTATSRSPAGTPKAGSNTAVTRGFREVRERRTTSRLCHSPMRFGRKGMSHG